MSECDRKSGQDLFHQNQLQLSPKEPEEITTRKDTTGEKATPSKEDYLDGAIIYGFAGVFTTR